VDELAIIERFFRPLAGEGSFGLRDDAARLAVPAGRDLVVTADMIAVSVHFLPDDPPATIAAKALRVNLSDLAAKGAAPLAYTLSLGLGPDAEEDWLAAFAAGLRRDQERFGVALIGGDTIAVASGPVIAITAFGAAPGGRMVHRFGGKAGDALYVSGEIGAGAAGLAILKGRPGPWDALPPGERDRLVGGYRLPEPRVALASVLAEHASAAMDISDGLLGDCDKLAATSGCSATIRAEAVPLPMGLAEAGAETVAGLLAAGDDYEILAAIPPAAEADFRAGAAAAGVSVTRIGELTAGSAPTQLLVDGVERPVYRRAYIHGA